MPVKAKRSTASGRVPAPSLSAVPSSPFHPQPLDLDRLRRKGSAARKARGTEDKHAYFVGVAEARYVLRKVFRIVEEQAKKFGLDPLLIVLMKIAQPSREFEGRGNFFENRSEFLDFGIT